jgi:hypothetical protein
MRNNTNLNDYFLPLLARDLSCTEVIVEINVLVFLNQYLSYFSDATPYFAKSTKPSPTVLIEWYLEIEQDTIAVVICKSHMSRTVTLLSYLPR